MLATVLACGSATAQVRVKGSVFGGGNNADVQTNTVVNISAGQVDGNVYGGGNLGDVGTINKTNIRAYKWTDEANPGDTYTYNNTGSCTVTITGGTIGPDSETTPDDKGNVFGAGKGVAESFWCEKAMVYKTTVSITNGTVKGDVYGGGEIGRVETNTTVTIGTTGETGDGSKPAIIGNVFGAGAGLKTHGYSALVRGNTEVTVQGTAKVGKSVYGGGEIATVGKYNLVQKGDMDTEEHRAAFLAAHPGVDPLIEVGMPYSITSDNLGICTVSVKDNAVVGQSGSGDVFGAGKGVIPAYANTDDASTTDVDERSKRMASYDSELYPEGGSWEYSDDTQQYVWEYFDTEAKYLTFVQTLALATQTSVTVGGSAQVNGSVYGGSESGYVQHHTQVTVQETCNIGTGSLRGNVFGGGRGISGNATAGRASGNTTVNILGGTTYGDVYGGGEKGPVGTSSTTTTDSETSATTTTYPTATVNLLGGTITGDAYGGGLGDASTAADAGNTQVNLNGMALSEYTPTFADYLVAFDTSTPSNGDDYYMVKTDRAGCKVTRIFGANNTNGTPKGNVTVHVYATQSKAEGKTTIGAKSQIDTDTYDLSAVYGGGNEAAYDPAAPYTGTNVTGSKSQVFIEGCAYTSIETVYGGGNAAAVPETNVRIVSDHEIGTVFGGGNGKDNKSDGSANPGADIGTKDQGSNRYGTGNAKTLITGGYVHEAYGGSNERGTIMGSVNLDASADGICDMVVKKMVGAGKNADIMGDAIVTLGCMPETWVDEYYGGADNANVHGNVELTITSGNFRKVFGGNNQGGIIMGHIKVNIEETGCRPINIDELYLGGNMAAYSAYGYYVMKDGAGDPVLNGGKLAFNPRESADDTHQAVKPFFAGANYQEYTGAEGNVFTPYTQPELNIISCTRIGKVFGGGLGVTAKMYADPTVNINQIYGTPGNVVSTELGAIGGNYTDAKNVAQEGGVFGGGNQAAVYGNTTVNIGNLTEVAPLTTPTGLTPKDNNKYNVEGANIVGNVYGGGNLANVGDYHLGTDSEGKTIDVIDKVGHTFVNICALRGAEIMNGSEGTGRYNYTAVNLTEGAAGVTIGGDVFGGGKGEAADPGEGTLAGAFRCGKAMVTGATNVAIGNGTVSGTVYGGGEVGRVEQNTSVTIGMGDGAATPVAATSSAPVITKDVFGAGKGVSTHGYAALVRGHAYVNVGGNAQIKHSVYGGGEIASVGRYNIADNAYHTAHPEVEVGMPYSLKDQVSGYCYVNVGGYAEIGEDDMSMTKAGGPDDFGYIFGAGKGILPYEGYNSSETPWRVHPTDIKEEYASEKENDYLLFIESLALATHTYVTVGGHAFVKGSVYGGSENGHVQHDTDVKIQDHCQIGNGDGVNSRYAEDAFINPTTTTVTTDNALFECAHWPYGKTVDANNDGEPDVDATGNIIKQYLPYDKYDSAGGDDHASDGHTFYGNVFGGGSGLYPYKKPDGTYEWLRSAGRVYGNTSVEITGGHILTSVYGGCELTDVGDGLSLEEGKGTCKVKMSGGTLGVPRTLAQIAAHPVTCYLFGAGKGDQRTRFNQWTNVGNVIVEINDSVSRPIIYGSIFGGGEDGHVLGNVYMNIKTMNGNDPVIGTWGTSYVEGNVFGGGRGFGGDALTAGVVCGNVNINIQGGKMLGSIYGGGRLGSVGTYLVPANHEKYGQLIPDDELVTIDEGHQTITTTETGGGQHGHVTINVSGGTIGNDREYKYYTFDVDTEGKNDVQIDEARNAALSALKTGDNIPNTDFEPLDSVQEGNTRTYHYWLKHTKGGNIFAGSMGRFYGLDNRTVLPHWPHLGKVKSTKLTITGGTVKSNVYGGGELGWTEGTHSATIGGEGKDVSTEISISGGTIGTEVKDGEATKYTFGSVFGGGYGSSLEKLVDDKGKETNPKFQAGRVKYSTKVDITGDAKVQASVYGGGEVASVGYGFQSYVTDGVIGEAELTSADKAANTYVSISGDAVIGKAKDGDTYFGGATMGNVYGGGSGNHTIVRCGLILGNTNVNVSGGTIYHNIYGGGAYGSVGDYEYDTREDPVQHTMKVYGVKKLHTTGTGTANVTITGGTIGVDGRENGMVFGSSRGDVLGNMQRDDYMAWVNEANVTIGTVNDATDGPQIAGSVYGSGENGHTLHNTNVTIHSGTIGILSGSPITGSSGKEYKGAEYPYRGNVYGGGCGTDTYTEGGKTLYNPLAGLVKGNATVTMDGGRVARTIYGGGAMGSVGTFTYADAAYNTSHTDVPVGKPYSCTEGTGLCSVTISGGSVGPDSLAMPHSYGNVFGAGRGEVHDPTEYTNLETAGYVNKTLVTVSGSAFVRGSVYGGAESGHVLADTHVKIQGGQIGCGKTTTEPYGDNVWAATPTDATDLECASWPYKAPYTPYDKFAKADGTYPGGSSAANAHPTGTDGHTFYGNVFGGGSGYEPYAAGKWLPTAGWVEGNTTVEITGGHILTSVYGGNEMSDVGQGGVRKMTDLANETPDMFYDITKPGGKCTVKMSGGTLGVPRTLAQIAAHPVTCYLFGAGKGDQRIFFNKTTNVNNVEVEISGTARIYGSVFGGGEDGHVMRDVKMTIKDNAYIGNYGTSYVEGNVFGGGRGFSGEALTAGNVGGCVNIDIQGGTMLGSVYGGGRLGSVGHGLYLVDEVLGGVKPYGILRPDNTDDRGRTVAGFERGNITINISGGTIGNDIEYTYNPTADNKLKMPSTTFDYQNRVLYTKGGNVFAGCMGRLYSLDGKLLTLWPELGRCKNTVLNITGGHIKSNVYGGAELGVVQENTKVSITGGIIGTTVGTGDNAYIYGSAFGGGKGSNDAITYPDGTTEAKKVPISEAGTVHGNVVVELNKGVATDKKGGIVNKIFGCNDMNGTPKGTVTVHVYATQTPNKDNVRTKLGKDIGKYDVETVYGGGNLAAYNPTDAGSKADTVIIDGCDLTSIKTVYGGGNAASVPATEVIVNGTYEIGQAFGGGNGMDKLPTGADNPGANVGYLAYTDDSEKANKTYGTGKAHVTILGGTVHEVYGGSNTKGNVRWESRATLVDADDNDCEFNVTDAYGGGRNALQDGNAILDIGCITGLGKAYGGASNADVNGNVILNITNGTYGQVFGGNDAGGCIHGSITVNIEETGCNPIIIGELYGGGNQAAYSVYGYNDDGSLKTSGTAVASPTVNVRSFTSIGRIFGGGYGNAAKMVGDPTVNINVLKGKYAATAVVDPNARVVGSRVVTNAAAVGYDKGFPIPSHDANAIGAIQDVFGGGNAAEVVGTPHVMIGTSVGDNVVFATPTTSTEAERTHKVEGVDIRGNVFGGGNNAPVTGNTNVEIGKKNDGN